MLDFLDPPREPGELGRLGQYRIVGVLDETGLFHLLQAECEPLNRPATLLVLKPEFAALQGKTKMLASARALAALQSPYVVTLHVVGEEKGRPFVHLARLQSPTLGERLRQQPRLPLAEVLRLGREIAFGLAAFHQQGLVQRDLDPGIIYFGDHIWETPRLEATPDAVVKPVVVVKLTDLHFTVTRLDQQTAGGAIGTPGYLPPEQAHGELATPRSDLFSLGVILYQLCAGELPFRGATVLEQMLALTAGQPWPVRDRNPEVPVKLGRLIHQLLEVRPELRPASATEVAERLTEIERELQGLPPPSLPPPSARRGCLGRATLLLAILLGVLASLVVTLAP